MLDSRPDEFSEADEQALGKLAPEIVLADSKRTALRVSQQEIEKTEEGLLRTGQLVTQSLRLERVLGEVITQAKSILSEMDIITLYYRDRATGKIKLGGHEDQLPGIARC